MPCGTCWSRGCATRVPPRRSRARRRAGSREDGRDGQDVYPSSRGFAALYDPRMRLSPTALLAAVLLAPHVQAGHDDVRVGPALQRSPGKIVALGDAQSFEAKPPRAVAYQPDELRGWRLTMIVGQRFGAAFRVVTNTEARITVAPSDRGLEGIA